MTTIAQDFIVANKMEQIFESIEEPTNNFEASNQMCSSSDSSSSSGPTPSAPATTSATQIEDDQHVYTNIREIEELNSRPIPPTPPYGATPKRDLLNGWFEFETDVGRTFFHNRESGRSQWIPPRFIRTPAQVQEFLRATRSEIDENCTYEGSSLGVSEKRDVVEKREISTGKLSLTRMYSSLDVEDEVFDEVCNEEDTHEDVSFSDDPPDSEDDGLGSLNAESTRREPMHPPSHAYHTPPDSHVTAKGPEQHVFVHIPMSSFSSTPQRFDPFSEDQSTPKSHSSTQKSASTRIRRPSPTGLRSVSFSNNRCHVLKNVPMPQVMPTISDPMTSSQTLDRSFGSRDRHDSQDTENEVLHRRGSSESREPVRTIRCGDMERCEESGVLRTKKREWMSNYMYLMSAHVLVYKDQKSAEKHGKHYDAPMCVWDLRGARVEWAVEKEKKKRRVIQLELFNSSKYILLRTSNDNDTIDWYRSLEDVVSKLPTPTSSTQAVIDANSVSIVRNPSIVGQRPLSHALLPISKPIVRRSDAMTQSAIETSTGTAVGGTGTVVEEKSPSKESILEKLRRFFRTRPSVESLKEKGIYKPEPVFGSTLSAICQHENSYVPKFIRVVIEVIETKGLDTDGIYRVSGNLSAVQKIRCQADQDNYKALVAELDIHVLTGALKLFFRELSEPLFPTNLHKEYTSAMQTPNVTTRSKKFEELLNRLPNENRETLKMLLRHLNRVAAHSPSNRMQQNSLAIVFGPTLFHNGDGSSTAANSKNKKSAKKKSGKKDDQAPIPVQSNSHLAFTMIMQSQIVQYLLESANKFEILKTPVQISR